MEVSRGVPSHLGDWLKVLRPIICYYAWMDYNTEYFKDMVDAVLKGGESRLLIRIKQIRGPK